MSDRPDGTVGEHATRRHAECDPKGDHSMPLTLSSRREVSSRHVAMPELPTVPVEIVDGTRTNVERNTSIDIVEEWGVQSFPASDPPMNW
jgi:hypothetical protein